jgi:alkylhydroperoxidase/carboxymuconolactone decarboxylase family protein YurZ
MNKLHNTRALATLGLLAAVGGANAAAVDVAAVVTDIGAQAAPITLIGGAVLLIVVGIKAFQWVRRAMS